MYRDTEQSGGFEETYCARFTRFEHTWCEHPRTRTRKCAATPKTRVRKEREREIGGQDDSEGALEVRNARGLSPTDWHRSELLVALYARNEDKRRFVHTRSPLSFSSFL